MPPFVFFGSSQFSVFVLDELKNLGVLPIAIHSTKDKPRGRGMVVSQNIVKIWAQENNIKILETTDDIKNTNVSLFIVASYGRIIPQNVLDMAKDVLNIHPSLLPKYRGPSPIQTAILDDEKNTGISIMKLDAEMDHGPILAQKTLEIKEWLPILEMKKIFAKESVELLLNSYKKTPVEQDHQKASYTKKILKEDGLIDLHQDPYLNYRKYCAFTPWPSVYYFAKEKRIKITKARYENGQFIIEKIIPEGKKEMDFNTHYLP